MIDRPDTTPPSLAGRDWLVEPALQAVLDAIAAAGGEARVAGGAVRNALIGEPVSDVDIATDLTPDEVIAALKGRHIHTVPTGIDHGTVTAVVHTGERTDAYEVTTLRHDVETDGRRARVAFTDNWQADAARRDFTMNALYCDARGTVFDPVGGYDDLSERRVRFVGDPETRIREDYLRILRLFRIHAQYGRPPMDAAALAACAKNKDGLAQISAERVRREMLKLLVAPGAREALAEMAATGVLAIVLGEGADLERFAAVEALEAASKRDPDALMRLAALAARAHDDAARLRARLVLTNEETRRLERLLDRDRAPVTTGDPKAHLYRLGKQTFCDAVLYDFAGADKPSGAGDLLALADTWTIPVFPLSGGDVVDAGVAPGTRVGSILRTLESEWVASDFRLDDAALHRRLMELVGKS